jgi:hypothetical protein
MEKGIGKANSNFLPDASLRILKSQSLLMDIKGISHFTANILSTTQNHNPLGEPGKRLRSVQTETLGTCQGNACGGKR